VGELVQLNKKVARIPDATQPTTRLTRQVITAPQIGISSVFG
jgi:hypothetical protein